MEVLKHSKSTYQNITENDLIDNLNNVTHTLSQEEENNKVNKLRDEIVNLNTEEVYFLLENEKYSQKSLNLALIKAIDIIKCPEKYDIIFSLLNSGANPNITLPSSKISILMKACSQADLSIIHLLLENKANTNLLDSNGRNCLFYALDSKKGDNSDVVSMLISYEVEINILDKSNDSPLIIACRENLKNSVKVLLEHNANINIVDKNCLDNTLLHIAVEKGSLELVKLLVNKNINMKAINSEGNTAMVLALKKSKTIIYQYLNEEYLKKQEFEKKTMDDLYKDSLKSKNIASKTSKINITLSKKDKTNIVKGNKDKEKIENKEKDNDYLGNNVTQSRIILPKNKISTTSQPPVSIKKGSTQVKNKSKNNSILSNGQSDITNSNDSKKSNDKLIHYDDIFLDLRNYFLNNEVNKAHYNKTPIKKNNKSTKSTFDTLSILYSKIKSNNEYFIKDIINNNSIIENQRNKEHKLSHNQPNSVDELIEAIITEVDSNVRLNYYYKRINQFMITSLF